RTRLKDPDAMSKITRERVIAAFDRLCADRQLTAGQQLGISEQ
ncbi:TPA: glycosyltransferase family 9 protein, partial [Aeromonas hydrophila]